MRHVYIPLDLKKHPELVSPPFTPSWVDRYVHQKPIAFLVGRIQHVNPFENVYYYRMVYVGHINSAIWHPFHRHFPCDQALLNWANSTSEVITSRCCRDVADVFTDYIVNQVGCANLTLRDVCRATN